MSVASTIQKATSIRTCWIAGLLLCGLLWPGASWLIPHAQAQTGASPPAPSVRSHPGYVDLVALGNLDDVFREAPAVEVNVEGALLELVVEASRADDPELAHLLERLDGLFVRGWPASAASEERIRSRMGVMGTVLAEDGWQTIVSISDGEQFVRMYARMGAEGIVGLVVMSMEEEAVFLNIVGDVDPEQIGRIGSRFRVATGAKPR